MNKNLKPQILELRKNGKTVKEIKETLNCSYSTIAYHLYEKTRKSTSIRINKNRQNKARPKTPKSILIDKYSQFFRIGKKKKIKIDREFSIEDLQSLIQDNPKCYLSGRILDFSDPKSYSLDHKHPSSKGGGFSLNNVGICSWQMNKAKNDLSPSEFIQLCREVLENNGFSVKMVDYAGVEPAWKDNIK